MQHLNSESLKKHVFKWLFETLDKLTKLDRQQRMKQDTKTGMDFTPDGVDSKLTEE